MDSKNFFIIFSIAMIATSFCLSPQASKIFTELNREISKEFNAERFTKTLNNFYGQTLKWELNEETELVKLTKKVFSAAAKNKSGIIKGVSEYFKFTQNFDLLIQNTMMKTIKVLIKNSLITAFGYKFNRVFQSISDPDLNDVSSLINTSVPFKPEKLFVGIIDGINLHEYVNYQNFEKIDIQKNLNFPSQMLNLKKNDEDYKNGKILHDHLLERIREFPIIDQECGNCWAAATAHMLSYFVYQTNKEKYRNSITNLKVSHHLFLYCVNYNRKVDNKEEQDMKYKLFLRANPQYYLTLGCGGGVVPETLLWTKFHRNLIYTYSELPIKKVNLDEYPKTFQQNDCPADHGYINKSKLPSKKLIDTLPDFDIIHVPNELSLMKAEVVYNVLANVLNNYGAIIATTKGFDSNGSDEEFQACKLKKDDIITHYVVVVGVGKTVDKEGKLVDYHAIFKNSWGAYFGQDGEKRISLSYIQHNCSILNSMFVLRQKKAQIQSNLRILN